MIDQLFKSLYIFFIFSWYVFDRFRSLIPEEVANADSGAPCTAKHIKKKQFVDCVRKSLAGHGGSKLLTEGAGVACVKLCKASTYISNKDSTNVVFALVQTVITELKGLIFSPGKPFSRGTNYDVDLMIDCFVAFFHIMPHNLDVLKICLNLAASPVYHFVLVNALHRIATQPRLPFWPSIDVLYNKVEILFPYYMSTIVTIFNNKHSNSHQTRHTVCTAQYSTVQYSTV